MGALELTFHAVAESRPGPAFQTRFAATWPAYRRWYLRDGDAARPSYARCAAMLREHMPELAPVWEQLVELAGGGDLAARMLSLYDPPPLIRGCSQAALRCPDPVLVRNYDFDPAQFEAVMLHSAFTGRRVIGMSDCLWGLLDGLNDAGLAVSLAFGGRRAVAPGFAVPLVVRYLLETCETTAGALRALGRIPVQASYNLTMVDRTGDAVTAWIAPDRPVAAVRPPVATNHQGRVEWPEHATAIASVEREARLLEVLAAGACSGAEAVEAFLEPPLRSTAYLAGFGTLYTAVHRPLEGVVELHWPGAVWRQSLDAFEPGRRVVRLEAGAAAEAA